MTDDSLHSEIASLRRRLEEAESTLAAIRSGSVDAFVVEDTGGHNVYTLEGSDKPYRILVEQMQQGAVMLTDDADIAYCNQQFCDLLKWSYTRLVGTPLLSLLHEDEPTELGAMLACGNLVDWNGEAILRHENGRLIPVQVNVSVITGLTGLRVGILFTDLTAHRAQSQLNAAISALRGNEERYRTLFNSIDEGFSLMEIIFDDSERPIDFRYIEVNTAFEKQTGLADVVDKRIKTLVPNIEQFWLDTYGQIVKTGHPIRFTQYSDALQRWFDVYAFQIGPQSARTVAALIKDVTKHREAAEELKRARSRLDSTLASADIATWEFDIVKNMIHADKNLQRMFNVSEEAAAGGRLEDYMAAIHPMDRARVEFEIQKAIESGNSVEMTYRLVNSDGGIRWVVARGRIERNQLGQAVRLPGVVVDVTAQYEAEAKYRRSEELRRLALESADLGSWSLNVADHALAADERFSLIYRGNTQPITIDQAYGFVPPEEHAMMHEALAASLDPVNPAPYSVEHRVVHEDGSVRWVYAKGRANFEEGTEGRRLVSLNGTVQDITDRVRSEEAARINEMLFRQLANSIPQLAWTSRPDGYVDWYNDRWFEYTGLTSEQMQGWGWQQIQHPDYLPAVLERWKHSLETGDPLDMLFPLRAANGSFRTFLTRAVPYRNEEGQIIRWVGTNTDISEQQKLQDDLRAAAKELSEADRRKDEFLATLAHELRNPLSPIKTAAQLMQMPGNNLNEFRDLSSIIERQVNQMVRLIDDLLDVSRISRGKITLQKQPCRIADIVKGAIEAAEPFIQQCGHTLSVDTSAENLVIDGDAARLIQVLVNLLNNACKYTLNQGHIYLSIKRNGKNVDIVVRDNGIGLLPDQLTRIFEMFAQVDAFGERGQSGLGIGLSLVKNLVEMHEGTVKAESPGPNQGCVFTVSLPLVDAKVAKKFVGAEPSSNQPPFKTYRILVVEDTRAIRYVLTRLLQTMGHEVSEAENGQQGYEKALEVKPEVVISDISMPGLTGYELAQKIRSHADMKDVVLVALTGYGQVADRNKAKESGFDYHLVKPVDAKTLSSFLSELSGRRK